jgi:hypothetical protein
MFAKILASLVVVAALGVGGYTMYSNHACTGCPFSSTAASETDCCAVQSDCCDTASACCADGKVAAVAQVSGAPDCCFVGSPCCEGDDCCLKTKAKAAK